MSVTLKYGTKLIFNCDSAFDEQVVSNVTQTADSAFKKRGTASSKFAISSSFTTGIIGSKAITSTDLSLGTQIRFWIYTDIAIASNDLKIHLDNTANCASPIETLNVGAVDKDGWEQVTLTLGTPASCTAIISVGFQLYTDLGEQNIWIDDLVLVSESKTFNELYIKGFDSPDDEDCYPEIEPVRLLDGNWFENRPSVATRNIAIGFTTTSSAEYLFIRNWYFANELRQLTFDSETIDVIRGSSNFTMEWLDGYKNAKGIDLTVREKTARALGSLPSSWTN